LRIAFIAHNVNHQAGPAKVTAALIERLCEDHQVSVFSHTIEGIDLSKIKHHRVPAVMHPKFLAYISFLVSSTIILAVLSLFRKRDFDIIHGYVCAFSTDVITFHFCEREGLRLEEANIIEMPHKSALQKLKALDHRIYRRLAAFVEGLIFGRKSLKARIVVSQRLKKDFVRHYGNAAESIIVIPNGVDLEMFNPANRPLFYRVSRVRGKHGISRSDLVLMFAGGDWERKGVVYIIEALSLIPRPDVKLLIVGSGDEKSYGQLAELKQVRERVTFISHSNNLWEYYAASDVFVFPTIYEPFGLVIAEAMASGLPVISSRVAGAADLIIDGVNGILLRDPSDVNDLVAKIELLLSNAELRKTMGERARETAEKLSWDRVAEETRKLYNSVLKRKRGVPNKEHA